MSYPIALWCMVDGANHVKARPDASIEHTHELCTTYPQGLVVSLVGVLWVCGGLVVGGLWFI